MAKKCIASLKAPDSQAFEYHDVQFMKYEPVTVTAQEVIENFQILVYRFEPLEPWANFGSCRGLSNSFGACVTDYPAFWRSGSNDHCPGCSTAGDRNRSSFHQSY